MDCHWLVVLSQTVPRITKEPYWWVSSQCLPDIFLCRFRTWGCQLRCRVCSSLHLETDYSREISRHWWDNFMMIQNTTSCAIRHSVFFIWVLTLALFSLRVQQMVSATG